MQDDPQENIRRLAALAGLPLSEERIAALVATMPFVQAGLVALTGVDYRQAEPAARFRPRSEPPR